MAKLLIVDDDAAVGDVMALVLRGASHTVSVVHSRDEALELLKTETGLEGAIIDVWLKGEDGLEFASQLKNYAPRMPFIIVSGGGPGRSLETVTARADAIGAHAMLFKPFDNDELLDAVSEMLA